MIQYKNTPRLRGVLLDVIPRQLGQLSDALRIAQLYKKINQIYTQYLMDIFIDLPAELNARRQQYEYYRNKLLTFKEKQ